ncbi:MAG: hypothetical protein ABIH41_00880, partial [Nanoarchaeota archaeon]
MMKYKRVVARLRQYHLAISREVYPQLVGLKQEIDTKKVVERFADLFCEDTLAIIVKERETE